MGDVLFIWTAVSNMFGMWMRTMYHACSAACIHCLICVWSNMFNGLATHFNISMLSPSNNVWWCLIAKHFQFGQALRVAPLPQVQYITDFGYGIHLMFNWQLSKQAICRPASHDCIAGSDLELIKVVFFLSWLLTRDWFFDCNASSSQVITLGEKEWVCAKAKFWCKSTPGMFSTFLPEYSLQAQLSRQFVKLWLEKIAKPHAE